MTPARKQIAIDACLARIANHGKLAKHYRDLQSLENKSTDANDMRFDKIAEEHEEVVADYEKQLERIQQS